ncbi:MAG TPA: AAA family ATPase, partial [Solirubrobacter sp.]
MALPATPEPGAPCPDLHALAADHPWLAALAGTPQDPAYHGEGDVLRHTQLVAEQLLQSEAWQRMDPEDRGELWLATLLHDAGKPATTRYENGRWTAPGHARRGAIITRRVLWEAGLSPFARERICALVRHHMAPYHLIESDHATRRTIEISLEAGARRQHLLTRADALGRIAPDVEDLTTGVDLFAAHAEELGCLDRAYAFASDHARFAYFTRAGRDPAYAAHDDTRSRVVVLSGLPGAGKDQWIARHHDGRPSLAFDDRERARSLLRAGRPFIWNATHHSRELRAPAIALLADYHAHVTIVAVEARPDELRGRNQDRRRPVAWEAVERVL